MNYCPYCGKQIAPSDTVCGSCGRSMPESYQASNYGNDGSTTSNNKDGVNFVYGIIGFLFPLIGLILFIVFKESNPQGSKYAGTGALVKVILAVIVYLLFFVFAIANTRAA